ncbi:restriction endonuclease subunit S [Qipengyuania gaetbuli]|uniref:restriction endonuclease subunit S n=1 Tax=Qipengyuania gaetbuli TaxID=266952 RepID=UPI001CFE79C1|nr:restriction endonuclease subunit S [Qipengyuania gaetbuli]
MTSWTTVRVGDLVAKGSAEIKTGPFGTQLKAAHYVEEGCPVINVRNVGLGGLTNAKLEHVADDTVERLRSHLLKRGDIVFGRKAAVDRHLWVTEQEGWMQGSDCLRLRLVSDDLDDRFASFCLRTKQHRDWILNQSSHGSTMATLNQAIIERIEFPFPPVKTQQRIASILGAYDDLIEVNRRRVSVLEEMARGLFQEWFVRFQFPGHENVSILNTPDGPLPDGWEFQHIEDAFDFLGGGTPSKKIEEYWTGGTVDWYTPTDLTGSGSLFMDRSSLRITEAGLAKSSAKLFPADSIMMTSRATLGVISICTGPASTNQGFITCLPNERLPRTYLYHLLAQNVPIFIAHATGATFKEITKGVFKKLKVCVPDNRVTAQFEDIARPMHDMVLSLERSNRSLAASRDLLLPRLISGQLSVEAAERQLEDAA